jgi:hypothetical protein
MPLLFSYGTLQQRDVQMETFGRHLGGESDELEGLDHIAIVVRDVKASVAWYRSTLGLSRFHEDAWGRLPGRCRIWW